MFGGTISKTGETVPGTYRQHAYQDTWEEARPIKYDGELTPEVCAAIKAAWQGFYSNLKPESSWGKLRWSSPDSFVRVDVERRAVIVHCSVNLCD